MSFEFIVRKYRTMNELDQLQSFVAIARAGSISRAARQTHMAKSVLSKRLADLEARLGTSLITRTTRSLSLTDSGAQFLRRAEAILDELAEAEREARGSVGALAGKLRVAAPLSFGLAHLEPVIADFILKHPDLDVEIDFSDRQINLVEDQIDVAVRIGDLADSSLIARKVAPIHHQVAAAPTFWERHGVPTHPDDLASLDCLHYLNLARPEQLPWWGPRGTSGVVRPSIRLLASNGDFLADLAARGCGFVAEPAFILAPLVAAGRLQPVLEDYEWAAMNLYVIFAPNRRISAKARAFADAIIEQFSSASNPTKL
ncbi:MAG: LysR family transcriptional regulator [Pseudomonadota bacterium]